jgi:ribose 5-phosphate isomerase A
VNVQNYFANAEQREQLKRQAAEYAVEFIQSGMIVGLGVGSTATFAVEGIARRLNEGALQDISGIPCSLEVEQHARQLGIPLTTLEDHPVVDVTIDGADEVDPDLNLIKGGGGALLREKIVAQASKREIIIVDEEKLSPVLGTRWVVPIEVIAFGWGSQAIFLESLGARVSVRKNDRGDEFITDQGNIILDCSFGPIDNLATLAEKLTRRVGIVEHGLFLGMTSDVIVAGREGIRHLNRKER